MNTSMNAVKPLLLTLPAYFAGYLINGDKDNLTPEEVTELDTFLNAQGVSAGQCLSVYDTYYANSNDLNNTGGDVSEFEFSRGSL